MIFRFSCPYTSPQNGRAERTIQNLNNVARTLLLHASLPPSFWPYAIQTTTYLRNILPHKSFAFSTPLQALFHRSPTYGHLRTFGCLCFPNLSSTIPHKLSPRSTPCIFLGYAPQHRGYQCYDIATHKMIVSRHVTFPETSFPYSHISSFSPKSYDFLLTNDLHPIIFQSMFSHSQNSPATRDRASPTRDRGHPQPATAPPQTATVPPQTAHTFHTPLLDTTTPTNTTSPTPSHPMVTRSRVGTFKPIQKLNLNVTTPSSISPLPKSPTQAFHDSNWNEAMTDEYNVLIKNATWKLVPRSSGANIIRCHWLFKHKFRSNGELERHKARLVINGSYQ